MRSAFLRSINFFTHLDPWALRQVSARRSSSPIEVLQVREPLQLFRPHPKPLRERTHRRNLRHTPRRSARHRQHPLRLSHPIHHAQLFPVYPPRLREPPVPHQKRYDVPQPCPRLSGKLLPVPSCQRPHPSPVVAQCPRAPLLDRVHRRLAREQGPRNHLHYRRVGKARRQWHPPTSLTLRAPVSATRRDGHATNLQFYTLPRGNPGEATTRPEGPPTAGLEHATAAQIIRHHKTGYKTGVPYSALFHRADHGVSLLALPSNSHPPWRILEPRF